MSETVFHGSEVYPTATPGPVVTIGNFDGVHRGHRALVNCARNRSRQTGGPICAYTFHPAPRDVLRPDNDIPRIQNLDDRVACLLAAGADHVVIEPFTQALASQSARWFVEEIVIKRLGASAVVVGWDFRFGKDRGGRAEDLGSWLPMPLDIVHAVHDSRGVMSSSRVRQAVRGGDVSDAATVLGRHHDVLGTVIHGDGRGRTLGFPTANLDLETSLLPADGVYAVQVDIGDGRRRGGVANVGSRPTVPGAGRSFEVHLLDTEPNLYGKQLRVGLVERLRDERRFDGIDALVEQIHRDIARTRALFDEDDS